MNSKLLKTLTKTMAYVHTEKGRLAKEAQAHNKQMGKRFDAVNAELESLGAKVKAWMDADKPRNKQFDTMAKRYDALLGERQDILGATAMNDETIATHQLN